MDIEIKKANSEDLEGLYEMYLQIHEYHMPFDPLYTPNSKYEIGVKDSIRKVLFNEDTLVLVAKDGVKYAGFGVFQIITKAATTPSIFGFVKKGYVKDEYRGKGIFKAINKVAEDWFKEKGIEYVELSCDSNNEIGLKSWSALGFQEVKKTMRKKLQ